MVKKSCRSTVSASHYVDWGNINVSCAANMRIYSFKLSKSVLKMYLLFCMNFKLFLIL